MRNSELSKLSEKSKAKQTYLKTKSAKTKQNTDDFFIQIKFFLYIQHMDYLFNFTQTPDKNKGLSFCACSSLNHFVEFKLMALFWFFVACKRSIFVFVCERSKTMRRQIQKKPLQPK